MHKEIISEKDGGTETIKYNDVIKEIVWRDAEGKETVTFERIDDTERERLDSFADAQKYYTDLNDWMEQEPDVPIEASEDARVMDELQDLLETDEEMEL